MRKLLGTVILGAAVGLIAGCSHQPIQDPPPQHGEIPEGPGVFSGSDGKFYILGGPEKRKRDYY